MPRSSVSPSPVPLALRASSVSRSPVPRASRASASASSCTLALVLAGCASVPAASRPPQVGAVRQAPRPPAAQQTAAPVASTQGEPLLGCVHADIPKTWRPSTQSVIAGWQREAVLGSDGVPVLPFLAFAEVPANIDPAEVFSRASAPLSDRKLFAAGDPDGASPHFISLTGFQADPKHRVPDNLVCVTLVGCPDGTAQLIIMETTRDTAPQVEGEMKHILLSMRTPK